ncbi:alanine dehydrogenase [candidate division KSB1 bacterium]|nr:alanine dehydrogenase [candidate division KSB1 bacterium]NIR69783.1 alanine dehydrogenase [candidate division KSB1 bacterium]NIS22966.1 alanine dehydrogenase [candidate division KSB1 bacterium]NIT69823.1 alanine dehydrogenase [candidate division KSB1 bacterium]NIU23497.1 alanine dehydrogenase [candidate division KSB1 bacterium]
MNIGIPNEIAAEERRIALTPVGVYALLKEGHTVYVEKGAGRSCGFSDEEFREVGADVVFSHEEIFHRSELIAKIQPPTEEEGSFLEEGKCVYSFLNLGTTRKPVIDILMQRGVTALGYEFGEQPDGTLPILTAMSEIAGLLLPQIAGRYLESDYGGRGITLAGVAGIAPANVVILGAGTVGFNAARAFSDLGAEVLVLDRDIPKLREIDRLLNKRVSTSIVTPLLVERAVRFADVLIGAIFIHGHKTPHLVSEKMVSEMKPGSVILDVSIDQGGCVETSRPTTLSTPTFVHEGVIHYCVPNIPASVARTASHALNNSVLPWVLVVARIGMDPALERYPCLQNGTYLHHGQSTSESLSNLFDLAYVDLHTRLTSK